MWRPLSSLLLLLVEVAAALAAPTPAPAQAGAADGLSPGYFVEDEMGKCLDGSPPVYYHRPGVGNGATKWLLYYEGGGWCANTQECYDRSLTDLGSSQFYDKGKPLEWDMLTSDASKNPLLHNWNVVFVKYCDGGFFSSNRTDTEVFRGKKLYYRGKYIQEAIFRDLRRNRGMDTATEVIFGGCSAGAMATAVQVDYWAASDLFPPSVQKMTAVPDSGFLLPYDGPERCHGYESRMIDFYNFMGGAVDWALPAGCLAGHQRDPWRCLFFLENSVPFIATPLFIIQSKYDKWQREALFCGKPDDVGGNNRFGRAFEEQFYAVVGRNAKDGYLLDSCVRHCGSWNLVESTEGLTQEAAFRQWYHALPPTIRATAADTPQTVGRAVTNFLVQEGVFPPSFLSNATTAVEAGLAAVAVKDTYLMARDKRAAHHHGGSGKPKKSILDILFPTRRRKRQHNNYPASAPVPVISIDPGTPLSPFRYNNTGMYPCQACCRSGYAQQLAPPQQPEGLSAPTRPAAGGAGVVELKHQGGEGVQEVEIDEMGNVLLPVGGSRMLRVGGRW